MRNLKLVVATIAATMCLLGAANVSAAGLSGNYVLRPASNTGYALDAKDGLQIRKYNKANSQVFTIKQAGKNTYTIKSVGKGKYLYTDSKTSTTVKFRTKANTKSYFRFVKSGSGYKIRTAYGTYLKPVSLKAGKAVKAAKSGIVWKLYKVKRKQAGADLFTSGESPVKPTATPTPKPVQTAPYEAMVQNTKVIFTKSVPNAARSYYLNAIRNLPAFLLLRTEDIKIVADGYEMMDLQKFYYPAEKGDYSPWLGLTIQCRLKSYRVKGSDPDRNTVVLRDVYTGGKDPRSEFGALDNLYHELGHTIDMHYKGEDGYSKSWGEYHLCFTPEWDACFKEWKSGKNSSYFNTSMESFAESVAAYYLGRLDGKPITKQRIGKVLNYVRNQSSLYFEKNPLV